MYRRKLNRTMVRGLIWLYRQRCRQGGAFIDTANLAPREMVRTNQWPSCRWWGLIESQPNEDDPSKKESGMWRLTELGVSFTEGRTTVPSHCYHYNGETMAHSDTQTTIEQALGEPFHYGEMMSETGVEV